MIKQYLIVDCMSEYKKLSNLKGIKELLIEQLEQDIYNNPDERDVIEGNVRVLKGLALDNMTLNDIKKELECYSFKIIDLLDLQRDLEDYKQYYAQEDNYIGQFDCVLKIINNNVNGVGENE